MPAEIYDINTMRTIHRLAHKDKVARDYAGVTPFPVIPRPIPSEDMSAYFNAEAYTARAKEVLRNCGDTVIAHIGAFAWQRILEDELKNLKGE